MNQLQTSGIFCVSMGSLLGNIFETLYQKMQVAEIQCHQEETRSLNTTRAASLPGRIPSLNRSGSICLFYVFLCTSLKILPVNVFWRLKLLPDANVITMISRGLGYWRRVSSQMHTNQFDTVKRSSSYMLMCHELIMLLRHHFFLF